MNIKMSREDLDKLYWDLYDLEEPKRDLDIKLAEMMGWKDIGPAAAFNGCMGIDPEGYPMVVPWFTTNVNDILTIKPDKWVVSWNERFDGTHHISLHPRGDLGLNNEEAESKCLAVALATAIVGAYREMQIKETSGDP